MANPPILPIWSPRIKPYLIRRLYENDAQGIEDIDLIDQVGWALHSRCQSFVQANEATQGRISCPVCGTTVLHHRKLKQLLHCDTCGWECPFRDYLDTIRNQQLSGGSEVIDLFQQYAVDLPKAKESREKMLLIDQLIHGFHHYLTSGRTRRPVAVNLIDGDLGFVVEFLDHLTYGSNSLPDTLAVRDAWKHNIHKSFSKKGR